MKASRANVARVIAAVLADVRGRGDRSLRELTLRFVLKVAVVGLIAGTIFGYYLWDLRREEVRA